jgi:hypothetical protein
MTTARLIDGTPFPREYPLHSAGLLSTSSELLKRVGKRRVLSAVGRIVRERPELFRAKDDGDSVLVLAAPGRGWFAVDEYDDCAALLDVLGEAPTDRDHAAAVDGALMHYHPIWRAAFLGGDVINAKPASPECPARVWIDRPRFEDGQEAPRGAYAWVWPVSRRIEVEDVSQRGLMVSAADHARIAAAWFVEFTA